MHQAFPRPVTWFNSCCTAMYEILRVSTDASVSISRQTQFGVFPCAWYSWHAVHVCPTQDMDPDGSERAPHNDSVESTGLYGWINGSSEEPSTHTSSSGNSNENAERYTPHALVLAISHEYACTGCSAWGQKEGNYFLEFPAICEEEAKEPPMPHAPLQRRCFLQYL